MGVSLAAVKCWDGNHVIPNSVENCKNISGLNISRRPNAPLAVQTSQFRRQRGDGPVHEMKVRRGYLEEGGGLRKMFKEVGLEMRLSNGAMHHFMFKPCDLMLPHSLIRTSKSHSASHAVLLPVRSQHTHTHAHVFHLQVALRVPCVHLCRCPCFARATCLD